MGAGRNVGTRQQETLGQAPPATRVTLGLTPNECPSLRKSAVDPGAPTSAGKHGAVNGHVSTRRQGVRSNRQARILPGGALSRPQPSRPWRGRI